MKNTVALVLFLCIGFSGSLTAATIHVPADQPTIQAGIAAAADGDTVLVGDGTWTGEGNHDIDFLGKAISVMSANGPFACIIDCQGSDVDHHRGFLFQSGEERNSVLSGFSIQNGYVDEKGGGIYCTASPTIRTTIIEDCGAHGEGAGLFCGGSGQPLIEGCLISNNQVATSTGGGVSISGSAIPVFRQTVIRGNQAPGEGGGIHAEANCELHGCSVQENTGGGVWIRGDYDSATLITDSFIEENSTSDYGGGGIDCNSGRMFITNTRIINNQAAYSGGAINCGSDSQVVVVNCLIEGNTSDEFGGACSGDYTHTTIINCTLVGNDAGTAGGGIYCSAGGFWVRNSIIWNNSAASGHQVFLSSSMSDGHLNISYSDLEGGQEAIEGTGTLTWGDGMVNADPLFISNPEGEYFLSQVAAGQTAESPCVDSGDPLSSRPMGTTRTDRIFDSGIPDMGWHQRSSSFPYLVCGAGPAEANPSLVRVYPPVGNTTPFVEFQAFGSGGYGVNVTCSNLDDDEQSEFLVGPGPGPIYGPHVRGFEITGEVLPGLSFIAYGTNKYGVNVAAGDLDGDGHDEIITGAGPGAVFGPHVRGWIYSSASGVRTYPGVSYLAYGTPKWGVNVAAGDIDGDGFDEIITGAGPGAVYGPHVRGWNVDGGAAVAITQVSFLAYGTNKFGVNISSGDVDGDGIDEIVTGAGPGAVFGPHIRGWNFDGDAVTPLHGFSFFAWQTAPLHFGVNVHASADLNGDGRADVIAGRGPDPTADTEVKVFTYDGWTVQEWMTVEAFSGLTHGAKVAAGRF
jgi:predicted outer membrane repeat protein